LGEPRAVLYDLKKIHHSRLGGKATLTNKLPTLIVKLATKPFFRKKKTRSRFGRDTRNTGGPSCSKQKKKPLAEQGRGGLAKKRTLYY